MTTEISPEQPAAANQAASPTRTGHEWWRTAVIYQIYPRSFADSDGDGIGDLLGAVDRLGALSDLGVDAVWLSPFYPSPQNDAGYDVADYCDVDPLFGTLADFDGFLNKAHELGMRVIIDLVPNHSSDQHAWFQAALAAPEGSPERDRYLFRAGSGPNGSKPPNNWDSVFGGPAWTRVENPDGTAGQWYLHLFDASQPDFNWRNRWVHERFVEILRFWLDRGVDGFRVDVAHGLVKAEGLPDYADPLAVASTFGGTGEDVAPAAPPLPHWAQEEVHDIFREWHSVLAEYEGDRVLCAEAWVNPPSSLALWVRPDEMHQAFNFSYLETPWSAPALKRVIDTSIEAFSEVGAPSTWVLSNHDVVRHASRLALTAEIPQGAGVGPKTRGKPNPDLGLRRARAATMVMLALPGSAYVYQGEELGLPEVIELPDEARQDPTWFRTKGQKYGRDGCRVPIPWESERPAYGFSATGACWLPQPADWARYARDAQLGVPGSTLDLYTRALDIRRELGTGSGTLSWLSGYSQDVIAFANGGLTVIANLGPVAVELPVGEVILASADVVGGALAPDSAVWIRSAS